jgi:hypothetical protein
MTIKKKTEKINEIISKGGQVIEPSDNSWTNTPLRIRKQTLKAVEECMAQVTVGYRSRNTWILEAIEEKIKKESK